MVNGFAIDGRWRLETSIQSEYVTIDGLVDSLAPFFLDLVWWTSVLKAEKLFTSGLAMTSRMTGSYSFGGGMTQPSGSFRVPVLAWY